MPTLAHRAAEAVAVALATGLVTLDEAGRTVRSSPRPGAYACLCMANSASLLLPVSNLTNLLALPRLELTFTDFALTMAPVLAVVLLVAWGRAKQLATTRDVVRAAHLGFAAFVLALGVVVAAISEGFLADLVTRALPSGGTSLGALALLALVATVLANLVTRSATLLVVPLLAPPR